MSSRLRSAAPSLAAVGLTLGVVAGSLVGAPAGMRPVAAVVAAWPVSNALLVSEVMTGGTGASDEFVELYDASPEPIDLVGDEVVYVTATGGTMTRKATWATSQVLVPGQHLLLADVDGIYAGVADLTYSGGMAAAGGSIAIRTADGTVIDAIGWGTAANGYVEGIAAPAPPAGSSLERLPGGAGGNATDSNDDATDWFVQASPNPQALADPLVPPGVTEPTTSASPTASPTATPPPSSAAPTASAVPSASPTPTPVPTVPPTADPTVTASEPDPTGPTPSPTPSGPTVMSIAAARIAPLGTALVVEGVLTTPLGFTDAGHGAFVQDASAGIALYLTGAGWPTVASGGAVRVAGTTDTRYGQATLRVAGPADLVTLGPGTSAAPRSTTTGAAGEALEGLLVAASGRVSSAPEALSDGFAVTIDDGSGPLRLVAATASGIVRAAFPHGAQIAVRGVLGQHAASMAAGGGYRVYLRGPADVALAPTASSGPTTSPGPGATPGSSAAPSDAAVVPIASLSRLGQPALVQGTVTSPGAMWDTDGRRFTLQDASAAILVRLPAGARPPSVGASVRIVGTLGHYLGAPEIGASAPPVAVSPPLVVTARPLVHGPMPGAWRWQLATAAGTVVQLRRSANSWRAVLRLSDGSRLDIGAGTSARVPAVRAAVGTRLAITGIVRPPATGASDPQLYLAARGAADVIVLRRAPVPGGGLVAGAAVTRPAPTDADGPLDADLADLASLLGRLVRVGGVVVSGDATRFVLDDGTAQVVVALPAGGRPSTLLDSGTAVTLVGLVARGADGALQVTMRTMADLALAGDPDDPLAAADEPTATASPSLPRPPMGTPTGASPLAGAALPMALLALLGLAAAALLGARLFVLARRRGDAVGLARTGAARSRVRLAALRASGARPAPAAASADVVPGTGAAGVPDGRPSDPPGLAE